MKNSFFSFKLNVFRVIITNFIFIQQFKYLHLEAYPNHHHIVHTDWVTSRLVAFSGLKGTEFCLHVMKWSW